MRVSVAEIGSRLGDARARGRVVGIRGVPSWDALIRRPPPALVLVVVPIVVLGLSAGCASSAAGAAPDVRRPPSIVLILADDAGFADFGFQAAPASDMADLTPRIDRIAAESARFDSFAMAGCVCSPSRAGLLTGRYQQRVGHERNLPPGFMQGGMDLGQTTIAARLGALGYRTACIGKWHLGYPDAYHPLERGFDHFYGCLQGSRSYLPLKNPSAHRVLLEDHTPTLEEGYVTDRLGAAAVRFIEASGDAPFFLYLSFTAPHGPLEPRAEDMASLAHIEGLRRRKYAGLVKAMDDNVGRVLAALDARGLTDDTVVILTNDNGGQTQTGAVNAPLRGRKGDVFEGRVAELLALASAWEAELEEPRWGGGSGSDSGGGGGGDD